MQSASREDLRKKWKEHRDSRDSERKRDAGRKKRRRRRKKEKSVKKSEFCF
jgi:hypothetical protein